jgi:hypothetical protein
MQREFTTAAAVDSNTMLRPPLQPPTSRSVSQAVDSLPASPSLSLSLLCILSGVLMKKRRLIADCVVSKGAARTQYFAPAGAKIAKALGQ